MFNPFPGLRPFEADEDHLFFGREKETDELLRRLRTTRFVSVVGSSGSGKSSLVRSGLIPSLHSGFMVAAGSSWRVATFRPGEDPVGQLAAALNRPDVLGPENGELADTNQLLLDTTLRRGALGLIDAVRHARIPKHDNLLVVVDQFEELFRFQRSRLKPHSRGEAIALVNLLLEATKQSDSAIYVVLTMRSDFIGDCIEYPGLPEAVNAGQYLVPRLSRSELRSAITGPVAVGGGAIAQRLVLRVLNDLGHNQDQLPVLQHALMRTWDHWTARRQGDEPMDIADYEAVGTLEHALSLHAEEAYSEAGRAGALLVERVFKALTDTFSDPRGTRRPTAIRELAEICEAPESDVIEIVEIFRRRGRSFLMPPPQTRLGPNSIVDVSHESLMRCWSRLIGWAEEERSAAGFYTRLSQAAAWYKEGSAGLWRDPELELALQWQRETHPTAAWAGRFDESFEATLAFLAASEAERQRVRAEQERERKTRLRRAQWAAGVFGTLFLAAGALAYVAWNANRRAELNFGLARGAVEEMLSSADLDLGRVGADVPQMQTFRAQLLEKAQLFYAAFITQRPRSEEVQRQLAFAHFRMGHINRMLERSEDARREYETAISRFATLSAAHPDNAEYREAEAGGHNWLGETLRPSRGVETAAARAYESALAIQERLLGDAPENANYRKALARTRYNRGILRANAPDGTPETLGTAEADFREAIRLLEPLAEGGKDAPAAQELARAYNNLGGLAAIAGRPAADIRALYERAIAIDEQLLARDPASREYKLELAKYYENLAYLFREEGEIDSARQRNQLAIALLTELARPAPSVAIELADSRGLRGRIIQSQAPVQAEGEYRAAFEEFERLQSGEGIDRLPVFHLRFADFLINLATLVKDPRSSGEAHRLLSRAVGLYITLAGRIASTAPPAEAGFVLDNLERVLPGLPEPEQGSLTRSHQQLTAALNERTVPAR